MKYFENLPQTTFETTIGTFTVANFFTYIDFAKASALSTDTVNIDSKTHLLEAASNIYGDPNGFWCFLVANNKINPFEILSENVTLFTESNKNKIDFKSATDTSGITGIAFPQGTIILPYSDNTGYTSSFTSIGNFDLNGPFAVVESVSYYGGNMVIKDQKGATYSFLTVTGATGQRLTAIYPNGTTYSVDPSVYVNTKKSYLDKVVNTKKPEDGRIYQASLLEEDLLPVKPTAVQATSTIETSVLQAVQDKSKNIKAFIPSEIGFLRTQFITVKYN